MIGLIIFLLTLLGACLLIWRKDFWNNVGLFLVMSSFIFCCFVAERNSLNHCQEHSQKIHPKVFQYDKYKILIWKHSGNFEEKFLKPSDSDYSKAESIFVDTCSGQLSE